MRRTRHVVLPVRSWQYIGFLIVSLACLTLGLVSRDREGHAGSLAGPELEHQAPHEIDVCPNLTPFVKMSSYPITKPKEATKPVDDHKIKVSGFRVPSTSRNLIFSRSRSLDRSSRINLRETRERSFRSQDSTTVERLSRARTRASDGESNSRLRDSRFRTIAQSRDIRNSADAAVRLSRSRDLPNRATDRRSAERRSLNSNRRSTDRANYRFEDRRSRVTERHEANEIVHRLNRIDRSIGEQRNSLNHRTSDHRDHKAASAERRFVNEIGENRRESREVLNGRREFRDQARRIDHRSQLREHRSRSIERRESNAIEQRTIGRRDVDRASRREDRRNPFERSSRIVRQDVDRNNNLDRSSWKRSLEAHRILLDRVANREHVSRFSDTIGDSRKDHSRSDERRSLSREMERLNINNFARRTLGRRVRSVESNSERSSNRRASSERRSSSRSVESREISLTERHINDRRFPDRMTSRMSSEDLRRERIDRSQRIANRRNTAIGENPRVTRARTRYDLDEFASQERRERLARTSRSLDRNSMDRREHSRIGDSRDRTSHPPASEQRDFTREHRERTSHLYRSRAERTLVLRKSRSLGKAAERRMSEKGLERQMSREGILGETRREIATRRRVVVDPTRRSSERRIDGSSRSREESGRMVNRHTARSSELRITSERVPEGRSALDVRRSAEYKLDESSKSHRTSRMQDRRLGWTNSELRVTRGRVPERRSTLDVRRSAELDENSRSRQVSRMQDRRLERSAASRNSISMDGRVNSRISLSPNNILRSSEGRSDARRDLPSRSLMVRRMARSVENRRIELPPPKRESTEQSHRGSSNPNVKNPSRLAALRRVVRISRVPEQNREQRRLSSEKTLSRVADDNRLSAKRGRNLQELRVDKNLEIRTRTVPISLKNDEFLKHPMTYDYIRQAVVVALCTIYGLSLYNGKKSLIRSNMMHPVQRFMVW